MLKVSHSLLKFRLYLWSIIGVLVLLLGSFLTSYTLASVLSIVVVLVGAIFTDRIVSKKNKHIDLLENMEAVNKAINNSGTVEDCSGLMEPDTLMRDNKRQSERCHHESKTNT